MDFEVGAILAGKVTGITKFGAFVTIAPGKSGLVHISEIANAYVSDVSAHLAEGQDVNVKVIGIDSFGRLNLSIKATITATNAAPALQVRTQERIRAHHDRVPQKSQQRTAEPASPPTFEDKLKRFMQDSDNKISGIKQYSDKKNARRRGR
ncbi:MAG: S1 RNA-binding domain-containing protein [Oscillospiraceae bacterium]|nr:S1 RNA-binding domain-containing protein [Oscillospiraceae bacterium]